MKIILSFCNHWSIQNEKLNAWISDFKLLLRKHNVCFVPGLGHLSPSLSPMVCFWHELMLWDGDGGLWDS